MPPRFRPSDTPGIRDKKLNELSEAVSQGGGGVYVLVDIGGGVIEAQALTVGTTPPSSPTALWVDLT